MAESTSIGVTEELALLEKKRRALLSIIELSSSLERMRRGYESVLTLRQQEGEHLPTSALRILDQLSQKIRDLEASEVIRRLARLDERTLASLSLVQSAMERLTSAEVEPGDIASVEKEIREFQRHAQTNIAMRVLLQRKNVKTKPLEIDIPVKDLREKIAHIAEQEKTCRKKAHNHIVDMRNDINRLVSHGHLSETQKAVLEAVDSALQENMEHLKAGKSVSTMPTPIEDIEIEQTAPHTPPLPQVEESEPPPVTVRRQRRGFWKSLMIWLNSPWKVSWRDIREGNDQKS